MGVRSSPVLAPPRPLGLILVTGLFGASVEQVAAQTTIDACYVAKTGVVYRIDPGAALPGDLPGACENEDKHFQFAWDPPGLAGYEIVVKKSGGGFCGEVPLGCKSSTQTSISCPAGKVVLSGGHRIEMTEGFLAEGYRIAASYRSAADTWSMDLDQAHFLSNTGYELWLHAICLNAG